VDLASVSGCGLERVTWLTFRRAYSWWAHDKGSTAKVIALMGHIKVDTTMNVYTQVLEGAARSGGSRRIGMVQSCSDSARNEGANSLKDWLLRLDSNQQPSG
jgi:hypothetical protein